MYQDNQLEPDDEIVTWTPKMPDRRISERRGGIDRRQYHGKPLNVPNTIRSGDERRKCDRRKKVRLTITGRAMDA